MERDNTLLDAARMMNKDALVKIFDLYSSALFNYTLRLCGDPVMADHIVGDVFVKLLDQLSAGNGPTSNLRAYLFEIAYHRIIDEARYVKRRAPLEMFDSIHQDRFSAFLGLEDRIVFQQIMDAIRNQLTADQRHVIILRFLEGFSLLETAAIMAKNVAHVKVIQSRAIAAVRRTVESNESKQARLTPANRNLSKALGRGLP